MHIETGHLVDEQTLRAMAQEQRREYVIVPHSLTGAANRALAGRGQTYIDLKRKSKLSAFAATKRKDRRKAARASRKRNR